MRDELRRMAMFGSGVVELTRYRAEQMVKGLVSSGDLSPSGAPAMVSELVERSRQTRRELTNFVRDEIKNQIEGLGLASKREVERLERRIARLEDNLKKMRESATSTRSLERRVDKLETASKASPARPSTGTPVGSAPETKPKSTAKKTAAKKTAAKKTAAKKTAAKKTATKKTAAKKTTERATSREPGGRSTTTPTSQAVTDAPAPGAPTEEG
jgi:polyhydroxyalkanoate synthesis regulator phasin